MAEIASAAVIGAGVMGAGIAAQIANAGVPVLLLDVSRAAAAAALDRLRKATPPAFMEPADAARVTTGSIADDLPSIAGCDWIVEAVVEQLDVKRTLYAAIAPHLKAGAAVSSNTSTIPLAELLAEAAPEFRRRFLIAHFFNPPRYMRLLEIVAGPDTDPACRDRVTRFADRAMGKSIVRCKDRPGFVANRLGCFWMQAAIVHAFRLGVTVEEADAVMGAPFGIPRTGVFGLADLVGIDLIPQVNASLARTLGPGDLFHSVNAPVPVVDRMIAAGLTGRKGKGGFYRIDRSRGKRKEAIDLATGDYRPAQPVEVDGEDLLTADTRHGRYARAVMLPTLAYAGLLLGDAADDVQSIDEAMRLGYNWRWGPFELVDRIGPARVAALLRAAVLPVAACFDGAGFYRDGAVRVPAGGYAPLRRPAGVLLLEDVKRRGPPLLDTGAAALWDLGDGIACFEIATKMNAIDEGVFDLLERSIDRLAADGRAMVVYSDATNFSAGVDLNLLLAADEAGIARLVARGQSVFKRLKYAPFPSVAAVAGLALGGGCELLMHCAAVQAHAESYIGLVEAGVGVIPAWGGVDELLARWQQHGGLPKGPMPAIARAFEIISMSQVSKSAADARSLLFLRPGDGITMNRDRLLADARARAAAMADGYRPPAAPVFQLPGASGKVALDLLAQSFLQLGKATAHDVAVAGHVAAILTGGSADVTAAVGEDRLLGLERDAALALAASPLTRARVAHTLATGKPLRN